MLTLKLDTHLDITPTDLRFIANQITELGSIQGELPFPWELIPGDELTRLEDRIDELEDTESELDTKVSELENQIYDLEDDIETLKDKLADRDATIEEHIETLKVNGLYPF